MEQKRSYGYGAVPDSQPFICYPIFYGLSILLDLYSLNKPYKKGHKPPTDTIGKKIKHIIL